MCAVVLLVGCDKRHEIGERKMMILEFGSGCQG